MRFLYVLIDTQFDWKLLFDKKSILLVWKPFIYVSLLYIILPFFVYTLNSLLSLFIENRFQKKADFSVFWISFLPFASSSILSISPTPIFIIASFLLFIFSISISLNVLKAELGFRKRDLMVFGLYLFLFLLFLFVIFLACFRLFAYFYSN